LSFFATLLFAVLEGDDAAQLVARLKRRDPDALEEVYNRFGKLVYSLIVRVVRDGAVAEELTQETFLRVWNRMQAFDVERGKFGPWLLTVARNRAIDYIRSVDGRMAHHSIEMGASEAPHLFVSMEDEVINSSRGRKLRAAFDELTPNQRLVIELAYFEGLSQSEMSAKLNQPLGTIKTWTRTALGVLRDSIGAETNI
jgi:RNA polymerase sigma-70 factor (ECF subfamily)